MANSEFTGEGFWATEQEALTEEAAWADQMEQEGIEVVEHPGIPQNMAIIGHPSQIENIVAGPNEVDAPVNPLDVPDHYDLPFHGSILACPKCGSDKSTEDGKIKGLKTHYHQQGVLHAPCGQRFGWPDVQNLGEHLCRTCERCGWGWPEQVFHGEA